MLDLGYRRFPLAENGKVYKKKITGKGVFTEKGNITSNECRWRLMFSLPVSS